MNLLAKEYGASQHPRRPGRPRAILFGGRGPRAEEAVIVDPDNVEGMTAAIRGGPDLPMDERRERWSAMMKILERNDITAWRERFARALAAAEVLP